MAIPAASDSCSLWYRPSSQDFSLLGDDVRGFCMLWGTTMEMGILVPEELVSSESGLPGCMPVLRSECCLFWALSAWCDLILVVASPLAWLQPGFRVLLDSQHHQLPSVALFLPAGISEFWAVWVPRETQVDWSSQDRKPQGQWEAQRSQQLLPVWAFSQGARTSPRWPLFPSQAHSHFFPPSEVLCWVPLL